MKGISLAKTAQTTVHDSRRTNKPREKRNGDPSVHELRRTTKKPHPRERGNEAKGPNPLISTTNGHLKRTNAKWTWMVKGLSRPPNPTQQWPSKHYASSKKLTAQITPSQKVLSWNSHASKHLRQNYQMYPHTSPWEQSQEDLQTWNASCLSKLTSWSKLRWNLLLPNRRSRLYYHRGRSRDQNPPARKGRPTHECRTNGERSQRGRSRGDHSPQRFLRGSQRHY